MRTDIPGQRRPWRALIKALMQLAGPGAMLLRHAERPWASVTFAGTRHTLSLEFAGADGIAQGEAFIAALPEHEFTISRQLVADATVIAVDHTLAPSPRMTAEVELLLVEDA